MKRLTLHWQVFTFAVFLIVVLAPVANAARPTSAEGTMNNGLRVVVATDTTRSSTSIALVVPMRLVYGYEHDWQQVTARWRGTSLLRIPYSYPTEELPALVLRSSLEEDPMALPDLIATLRTNQWRREIPAMNDNHLPSLRWFYGAQSGNDYFPNPHDVILAVNGTQPIDALWELAKSAGSDWNAKASIYRAPAVTDTLPRLWCRHRAGEAAEIVMFQPAPPLMTAPDAALRALVADERLERRLSRTLIRSETGAADCIVGLYPPLAPQWLWCVITGPADEAVNIFREINLAWSELIASPFVSVRTSIDTPLESHDRHLIEYCLTKLYQTPAPPSDSVEFRKAVQSAVFPERWTYLITTDTTRCLMPEMFLFHEW